MKKRNKFLLLFAPAIVLTAVPLLTSCSSDDDATDPVKPIEQPHTYNYGLWIYGEQGSQHVVLDSIASSITSIEGVPSWLTATIAPDTVRGGHPMIILECKDAKGSSLPDAKLTVTAENGDVANITVSHSEMTLGDVYDGSNASFIKEWWKCQTVQINGIPSPQQTPWTIGGGVNIPAEVRDSYRPDQGWEMAFCYLNDPTLDGTRYFALYNKYTGQLRVYTYLLNPKGEGNELSFMVKMGEFNSTDMYPLYHNYEFGIPSNHVLGSNLSRSPYIYDGQNQAFMTLVTPYRQSSSLANGWHCFDLDLSAYVPKDKNWLNPKRKEAKLTIYATTQTTQQITLRGSIFGDIGGTFSNERIIQHGGGNCMSGICGVLDWMSGKATSSISGANTYANLMTKNGGKTGWGQYLNPTKYWGGLVCSIASGALGKIGEWWGDPVSYDTIPGKIDLKADMQLDASGYITSFNSTDIRGLAVSTEAMTSANGADGHMGKGIWGLADDPVVYVDKEDLMSSYDHFNLQTTANGYNTNNFSTYEVRLVYAFDPTSVKVNINRDLYPEIYDVNVTTTIGVYPARQYGFTDPYRSFFMLSARPTFSLAEGKKSGIVRLNNSTRPRIWQVAPDELLDTDSKAYETKANSTKATQAGGSIHYYGRSVNEFFKTVMVNPQVYVPYSGGKVSDPVVPDFVVAVTVSFYTHSSAERPADADPCTFSKVFIPEIKLVSRNEMKNVSDRLQAYSNTCKNNNVVGTLANDSSIPVYQSGGDQLVAKTLRMLKKIGL